MGSRAQQAAQVLLLAWQIDAALVLLLLSAYLKTLVASHDVWKPESRRQFRSRMLIEMGPLFRLEAVPKMKTENFRQTNHQFRVFKAISYGTALRTAKSRFFPASKNRRTEVGLQTYHDPSFSECFQTATFHKYWYSTAGRW